MNSLKKINWIATPPKAVRNDGMEGFTLIELLVAMGIIAVLTGMAAFNFNQSRVRARDVQRKNDLSQIQKAMEVYKNDTGSYPDASGFQDTLKTGGYTKVTFNDPRDEWSTYYYSPDTAGGLKTYYLMACLENKTDQTKTTDETVCGKFRIPPVASGSCLCGSTSTDTSGVMYTLSQP